jgi:hypothetical protein
MFVRIERKGNIMKTAICFAGTGRSIQHTHDNIKKMLVDSIDDCDAFFLIPENTYEDNVEKYMNISQTKRFVVEPEADHNEDDYLWANWPAPGKSRSVYLKMIYARERCNDILAEYEKDNNIIYDRVIFSRLDVRYFDSVADRIAGLDLKNLYVPDFHNTFGGEINGYNDRFAISSRENMDVYFGIPKDIHTFCSGGGRITAETVLKWHLLHNNVNVENIPVRFARVKPDGTEGSDIYLRDGIGERDS